MIEIINKLMDQLSTHNKEQELITNISIDEVFESMTTIDTQKHNLTNNTYDYVAPDGSKYIILERDYIKKILDLLSNIIDLSSINAINRGLTIRIINSEKVDIVCPNSLYYFKSTEKAINTLNESTTIFIEYLFLIKIAKFLPPKMLIYSKDVDVNGIMFTKYYIRLKTGDLELVNTTLIASDIEKIDKYYCELLNPLSRILSEDIKSKIEPMLKVINIESDTKRRVINVLNNRLTFSAPLVFAQTELDLPNMVIDLRTAKYLKTLGKYCSDEIVIYSVNSEYIDKYAIVSGNTTMITLLCSPKDDSIVLDKTSAINCTAKFDYSVARNNLDYVNSIIYAIGRISLKRIENNLIGTFKLSNGSESTISLIIYGDFGLSNKNISLNTKSLLKALDILDPNVESRIGYQDGILFLLNDYIKIALITF